jgi:rod shape-determining protein MreD
MIGRMFINVLRFLLLILLQALVIDHIDLANGWITPYLYVLAILLLPFDTPPWGVLFAGFAGGMLMDLFSNTPGLHAGACTIMAFARPYVLRFVAPRDGYDTWRQPTMADMGMAWSVIYCGILVLVHQLWLAYAEVFRMSGFFGTLGRALLSGAATLALILLLQSFGSRAQRART